MIGTLRYVIQQLSKDDSQFTIDILIDEIVALEKKLDRNEKAVNVLNLENKELLKVNEKLKNTTILQLAQQLEHGLIHSGLLDEQMSVLEFIKHYLHD
jgi:hypothetical protein